MRGVFARVFLYYLLRKINRDDVGSAVVLERLVLSHGPTAGSYLGPPENAVTTARGGEIQ